MRIYKCDRYSRHANIKNKRKKELSMKKILAVIFAALLALTAVSALAEMPMVGGWAPAEDYTVTEERQLLFDTATEGLLGVNYVPVAYLGSQVVAGTNHCFLCQATVVAPDAQPQWKLVYLYEALDGTVTVLSIADFDFGSLCIY